MSCKLERCWHVALRTRKTVKRSSHLSSSPATQAERLLVGLLRTSYDLVINVCIIANDTVLWTMHACRYRRCWDINTAHWGQLTVNVHIQLGFLSLSTSWAF